MDRRDGVNRALQGRTGRTAFSAARVSPVMKLTLFHRVHCVLMGSILRMEFVWIALRGSTPVQTRSFVWCVQAVSTQMVQAV